jgi:hypothetical protein
MAHGAAAMGLAIVVTSAFAQERVRRALPLGPSMCPGGIAPADDLVLLAAVENSLSSGAALAGLLADFGKLVADETEEGNLICQGNRYHGRKVSGLYGSSSGCCTSTSAGVARNRISRRFSGW